MIAYVSAHALTRFRQRVLERYDLADLPDEAIRALILAAGAGTLHACLAAKHRDAPTPRVWRYWYRGEYGGRMFAVVTDSSGAIAKTIVGAHEFHFWPTYATFRRIPGAGHRDTPLPVLGRWQAITTGG